LRNLKIERKNGLWCARQTKHFLPFYLSNAKWLLFSKLNRNLGFKTI
jgi:hypothetical protein